MDSLHEVASSDHDKPTPNEGPWRALLRVSTVPEHLHDGIVDYVVNHQRPGSFLTAVLSNDLLMAVKRGDAVNRDNLSAIVLFLYDYAPATSWGSPETVAAWLSMSSQKDGV